MARNVKLWLPSVTLFKVHEGEWKLWSDSKPRVPESEYCFVSTSSEGKFLCGRYFGQ